MEDGQSQEAGGATNPPQGERRCAPSKYHVHYHPRRSTEPDGFPIIKADQIIVPGPLLKMTLPLVRWLSIIPKRVVGIEDSRHNKVGLRDPQCTHSEVSLVSLSDGRMLHLGDGHIAAPCCLQFNSQGFQPLPIGVPAE